MLNRCKPQALRNTYTIPKWRLNMSYTAIKHRLSCAYTGPT